METKNKADWNKKREAIYTLRDNIAKLKYQIAKDLHSLNEKDKLTALVIRIMIRTSERVGNFDSAKKGHFGITQLKPKHVYINLNYVNLTYKAKSGVMQDKTFYDVNAASLLKILKKRDNTYIFTTKDGFRIMPDRVNRYLADFDVTSKDIRGYNSNRFVVSELMKTGRTEEKDRKKVFNSVVKNVAEKIGHTPATLKNHYLLPEIQEYFYKYGSIGRIKIN